MFQSIARDEMDAWMSGHVDSWIRIYADTRNLDTWIRIYVDTWMRGYVNFLDMCIRGYVDTWKRGYLDT
jgi:hypothetical protein